MKKVLIMPVYAAVLLTSACGDEGGPTTIEETASVRFFNATEMTGSGGFTINGQFVTGSALAFGQSTPSCPIVNAGSTTFGFGAANAGGTGLNGSELATLSDKSITFGGDYTVAATGSPTSPTLFLLDNGFSGTVGPSQVLVRFVNLAPGTDTIANRFFIYEGAIGAGEAPMLTNLLAGAPTAYRTAAGGSNTFSVLKLPGHAIVLSDTPVTLQTGAVNTIAIVPDASTAGFKLINLPRCS